MYEWLILSDSSRRIFRIQTPTQGKGIVAYRLSSQLKLRTLRINHERKKPTKQNGQ